MTAHTEEIARLTGKLVFQIDASKLQAFNQMIKQASQNMNKLGAEYTKLAQQLTRPLRLKIDTTDADKAKTKLQQALNRELKAATALQSAQRQTFTSQISQQKLVYTGKKQQANLVTALVKDQQQHAVQVAKAAHAQQQANVGTKQQVASQSQLIALQAKQARLQQTYAKTLAITAKRDAQHLLTQSKAQQVQLVAQRIAQQTQHQAIVHQARMASLAAAATAKQTASNNAQTKFQWAQQKHSVWQANQAARAAKASSGGGIASMMRGGIGGIGLGIAEALGPVGMGLAAAAAAITVASNKMQERIEERQAGASEAEQYNNLFKQMGKGNPLNQDRLRKGYEEISMRNGSTISLDDAKMFRTYAMSELQRGKSPDAILKQYEAQQASYRIAGLTPDEAKRSSVQLQQIRGKAHGDTEDLNTLTEANPLLRPYVYQAWGEKSKFKNMKDPVKLEAAFMKALPKGALTRDVIDIAQVKMVADNQAALEQQRKSIQANLNRSGSITYQQANGINSDPELATGLNERTEANNRLTASMQPVNEAFERLDRNLISFDTGLINATSRLMNLLSGKQSDGTEKPVEPQSPTSVGAAMGQRLNKQSEQRRLDGNATDSWANRLRRFATGGTLEEDKIAADENRTRWSRVKADGEGGTDLRDMGMYQTTRPGFLPRLKLNDAGMSRLFGNYKDWNLPIAMPIQGAMPNPANTIGSPVINIEGANIHIELSGGATEEDSKRVMDTVTTELDKHSKSLPDTVRGIFDNMLGTARAQQADRQ